MRKLLIATVAASASLLAAAPASAQYQRGYGYHHQGGRIDWRIDHIQQRIRLAHQRGWISGREARRLYREAEHIERLHHRYRRGGLSRWEHRDLQNRIQMLRRHLRMERHDRDRWDRDRWDRDDRWRDRDDRWHDRDRRWDRDRDDDDDDDDDDD